jgi:beta-glucosidase
MEGGHALADVLFGKVNPSGKLPCVFPKSEDHLPFFDKNATSIEYDRYHGYRLMDRGGYEPAFPFGFGLSYTSFQYGNLRLSPREIDIGGVLRVNADVTNTGGWGGDEVVQLYVGYENSQVDRPMKELKGFVRLRLKPGETRTVEFELPARRLAYYDESHAGWVVEVIPHRVYVGPSSRTIDLLESQFEIKG